MFSSYIYFKRYILKIVNYFYFFSLILFLIDSRLLPEDLEVVSSQEKLSSAKREKRMPSLLFSKLSLALHFLNTFTTKTRLSFIQSN